ncbi:MAG: pitrilysin family protein [Saprospiraceae bacterium]
MNRIIQKEWPLIIAAPSWDLRLPEFEQIQISNGAQVYSLKSNKEGLCYLEFVFENGRLTEHKKLSSRVCASQIQEGTRKFSNPEIVDFFDFYGCSYSIHADLDFTVMSLSCLEKHFETIARFVVELLTTPIFPEDQLVKGKVFLASQLSHQLTEPDFVSYREFTAHLYGSQSPYGYNSTPELINDISSEDLIRYHKENYVANKLQVFYCGSSKGSEFWEGLLTIFPQNNHQEPYSMNIHHPEVLSHHIPMANCSQTSLKIGLKLFPKTHEDYYGMYMLNTILGDYFGSRLMHHIREKHGLTYDIHSTIDAQIHDGCFYISAELNPESREKSIEMIKKEIRKLRTKPVPDQELNMVRNYLNGHLLRLVDGPFQSILFLKILLTEFKSLEAFDKLVSKIRFIEQKELMELANKYLIEDEMSVFSAGA